MQEKCKDSEHNELRLKLKTDNKKEQYYLPSPQHKPNIHSNSDSYAFVPVLTDILVQVPEDEELKEEQNKGEDKNTKMEYGSDNTVKILR